MRTFAAVFVIGLGLAPRVQAQARLYTNADLGKPLHRTHAASPDELQGLVAHQFTLPENYDGPKVFIVPFDPNWPFTYARRLDPDPWRTPAGWPIWPYVGGYASGPYGAYAGPSLLWTVSREAARVWGAVQVPGATRPAQPRARP
jgi:hypothetical protein